MGKHSLRDVFKHVWLPTIPRIVQSVYQQLQQPKINFSRFSHTIRFDPGLVCALIGRANTKLNGLREVASIHAAILECGPKQSLEILRQTYLPHGMNPDVPQFEMFRFGWAQCVSMGVAAESLKEFGCQDDISSMFLSGLLADIGSLALMQTYMDEYYQQVWQRIGGDKNIQELEQEAFGFSHVTVGHELARHWRIGESFSTAILQHHHDGNGSFFTIIAQAASKIIDVLNGFESSREKRKELDEQLNVCFHLQSDEVDDLLSTVAARRRKILGLLELSEPAPAFCVH